MSTAERTNDGGVADILDRIRALPLQDREYVEAELMREAYEQGRRT